MRAEDIRSQELIEVSDNGFPTSGDYRVMVMGVATLLQLEKDLIRALGWPKVTIIFTRWGYDCGLAQAGVITGLYDFESKEEELKAGSELRRMSGLVDETITEIEKDPQGNIIRFAGTWSNSFEVLISKSESGLRPEKSCRILAGLASGFATRILGVEFLVLETSCQAAGGKACAFEGRPVEKWGLGIPEVKRHFAVANLEEELLETSANIRQAQEEMARLNEELKMLRRRTYRPKSGHGIVFRSESVARALLLAEKVAPTATTVLIQGESGTGKEVMAQFIHRNSGRTEEPFLAINCAALPPNLLESELFGHARGSFTGADSDKKGLFVQAGQGTLFLDEVGELPLELQAKILRALQEKEVRPVGGLKAIRVKARIVAATNQDLREMVAGGRFREDLYYRLSVFPIYVTPLRQRRQDILLLARHFLARHRPDHPGFSPEAVRMMEAYSWPGNVRELENWVEYAVVLAGDERIGPEHLPVSVGQCSTNPLSNLAMDLPSCEELEKRYIRQVLEHTGGAKTEAARILGLSISTLWRRLKEDGDR
ncbi:MAG: sigma 54-interacting transcriptional regulator [Pseudomonadota bacterium]